MKKRLFALALALMLAVCGMALAADQVTVTVFDSDGLTVLNEFKVDKGAVLTEDMLGVSREGYTLSGVFVTPALLRKYDGRAIDADTSLFVAWKSAVEDTRAWMLAGSLAGYPENNWGHAWPQDDFLLVKKDGEFNTFYIELNLYKNDEFKIAVIDQDYNWYDNVGSSCIADRTYIAGGEDAFATGANCKVLEDGLYGLTFVSDAETLELCKLYVERLGDAAEVTRSYDMVIHGSFNVDAEGNPWAESAQIKLTQNGTDLWWYGEFTTAEAGEFGIKNLASGKWFSNDDGSNIAVEPGHYIVYVGLTPDETKEYIKVGVPAYYVVGTCGGKGWGADAVDTNEAYKMAANDDGTYSLNVTFTADDTDTWTDGKVAFKVVYGAMGQVANDFWYGEGGDNIMVEPGEYTITFNPADGVVTVK